MSRISSSKGTFETEGLLAVSVEDHPAAWFARALGVVVLLLALSMIIVMIWALLALIVPEAFAQVSGLRSRITAVAGITISVAIYVGLAAIFVSSALYLLFERRENKSSVYFSASLWFIFGIILFFKFSDGRAPFILTALAALLILAAELKGRKTIRFRYASGVASARFVTASEARSVVENYQLSKESSGNDALQGFA